MLFGVCNFDLAGELHTRTVHVCVRVCVRACMHVCG